MSGRSQVRRVGFAGCRVSKPVCKFAPWLTAVWLFCVPTSLMLLHTLGVTSPAGVFGVFREQP
eukprot:10740625-Alexandrium_andersonii.AAC.1